MKSTTPIRFVTLFMIMSVLNLSGIPLATSIGFGLPTAQAKEAAPVMTQEQLQSAVLSYANRFIATVGQAAFQLERQVPTAQGRLVAANRKVFSLSAITEIAAGPNPGPALLDLVVMATLNRMVWEDYWRPQVFGMPATVMVEAFAKMEADAWALAAKVMTAEQMQEFRDLILDWYANNTGQIAVDYIRFSDFGDLGKKPNLKEIQKPGGLLAPVREATAAVDEVRMTSERAMFLATKMQLILNFQADLIYKQTMLQPEMRELLEDISGFRATAERFEKLMETLPDHVSEERSAAMKDVSELIIRERKAVLKAMEDNASTLHQLNTDLQKTTAGLEQLLQETNKTVTSSKELVTSVDNLVARFKPEEPSEPSKPFDINDYITAIELLQLTVADLNRLALTADEKNAPFVIKIMELVNNSVEQRINHVFWRMFQLAAFIGGIAIVLLVVFLRMKPKATP